MSRQRIQNEVALHYPGMRQRRARCRRAARCPYDSRSRSITRGPQRCRCCGRPKAVSSARSCSNSALDESWVSRPTTALTKSGCATGPNGREPYRGDTATRRVRGRSGEALERRAHLLCRIGKVAAHPDVSGLPDLHGPVIRPTRGGPERRRRLRLRRRGPGGACVAPASASAMRPRSSSDDLLQARPPLCHLLRRETELRAQQQQVVGGAEARMLEHAQRAPAARMLKARLQREHLAHAEREALRNRDACLRLAGRPVTGIENGRHLVPALRGRGLDDAGDRSIQQEREQEGRRHRLVRLHARIGVLQALQQQLLDQAARMAVEVGVDARQQCRQQAAATQHLEAARTVTGQEQLQRLIEEPRRRHAAQQVRAAARSARRWPDRSRSRASPRSARRAACAPDLRGSASPDRR